MPSVVPRAYPTRSLAVAESNAKRRAAKLRATASVRATHRALRHTLHKRTASADATVVAAIGLAVVLLFVIGGVAAYLAVGRTRAEARLQAERARLVVAEAERARAEAKIAAGREAVSTIAPAQTDGDSIRAAVERSDGI